MRLARTALLLATLTPAFSPLSAQTAGTLPPPPAPPVMIGGLQVIVNAPHAKVFLDGVFKGELTPPQVLNLPDLPVGSVQVRVEAEGYQARGLTYTIQPGAWTQAVFALVKLGGGQLLPPPPAANGSPRPAAGAAGPALPGKATTEDPAALGGATRNAQGLWTLALKVDAVTIELVQIPSGSFKMGSTNGRPNESPVHQVTFRKPFWMSKYPITQKQWQAMMSYNPSKFKDSGSPVENVTCNAADTFCERLNTKQREWIFRLPSEAEWEYACKAGSTGGRGSQPLKDLAWFKENSEGRTHPVGEKQPNAWGLYDMLGNVWQWCADLQHDDYTGAPSDGSVWTVGTYCLVWGQREPMGSAYFKPVNVYRGGGWNTESDDIQATTRQMELADTSRKDLGFRIVCVPK